MDTVIGLCFVLVIFPCLAAMGTGIGYLGPFSAGGAWCFAPVLAYLLALVVVVLPYQRALEYREAEQNWKRAADFIRRTELSQRFELRGWPPIIPGAVFLGAALTVAGLAAASGAWPALAIALLLAVIGSPMFLRNVPHLGAPLISCDARGFRSGAYGEYLWQEIDAVALQRFRARGMDFYTLTLRSPLVMQRLHRMHPCVRLLHRFMRKKYRDRLQFRLKLCGEAPRVVELVCFTLWERVVGTKKPWLPDDPRGEAELRTLEKSLADENRRMTEMAERALAEHGLAFPDHLRPGASSRPGAKNFRDKLERSRPVENALKQREMARIPTFRAAAIAWLIVIGGLLALAYRQLSLAGSYSP